MKRLTAMILFLYMAFIVPVSMAENVFYGNMEIVNCNEWVSLREQPSTSATRLKKVPLGAVVSNCRQHGNGWICASYEGEDGYIQAKYLQSCEGVSVCSAMLVSNDFDGTELYETIHSMEPISFIAGDTIVRNCAVMASGRAYVECGAKTGYVNAEHVEAYNELLHFPGQITLHCSFSNDQYEGAPPMLMVDDTEGFPLAEYDYSEYDFTEYLQLDPDAPKVEFVLHSDTTVKNVHLFSASLRSVNDDDGEMIFDFVLEHIQHQVDPDHPLSVIAVIYGDMPNLAVGYDDWTGAYHFAFVEISGEDGRILLREF